MGDIYREISEKNTVKGVDISEMYIRYPIAETVGRSDGIFEKLSGGFAESVRKEMFKNDEERFSEHVGNGGRRSAFPRRVYRLSITVCGENGNSVSVRTEASVTESERAFLPRTIACSVEYTVWDRLTGLLCDETTLGIRKKRGKRAHDGIFVDKNGTFYYDVDEKNSALPQNISDIGNILTFKSAR